MRKPMIPAIGPVFLQRLLPWFLAASTSLSSATIYASNLDTIGVTLLRRCQQAQIVGDQINLLVACLDARDTLDAITGLL